MHSLCLRGTIREHTSSASHQHHFICAGKPKKQTNKKPRNSSHCGGPKAILHDLIKKQKNSTKIFTEFYVETQAGQAGPRGSIKVLTHLSKRSLNSPENRKQSRVSRMATRSLTAPCPPACGRLKSSTRKPGKGAAERHYQSSGQTAFPLTVARV